MKTKRYIAVVLLGIFISACSSIRARTATPSADWTVYPGVQQDVREMGEILSSQRDEPVWIKGLVTAILMVDLPFSAVFDTFATPYDLYRIYTPEVQAEAR